MKIQDYIKAGWLKSKSVLKNIKRIITKYSSNIIIIVFVVVLFLIIYSLRGKLNNHIINMIVAFSALITAFFMYLTFLENKKSNDLKLSDVDYERLQNKIKRFKEDLNQPIQIFSLNPELKGINYSSFINKLYEYVLSIQRKQEYINYIHSFQNSDSIELNRIEIDQFSVISALRDIDITLSSLIMHFISLTILLKEIDSSDCVFLRRKELISEINDFCTDYYSIIYSYHAKDSMFQKLLNLTLFEIQNSKLVKIRRCQFDNISTLLIDIRHITEKYLE